MYSYNIFPLGVLTINQIERGQNILNNISGVIHNNDDNDEFLSLSNNFFTMISHISKELKVINTPQILNEKNELIAYIHEFS